MPLRRSAATRRARYQQRELLRRAQGADSLSAVPDLRAVAGPFTQATVGEIASAWEAGDAVVLLDDRLPTAAVRRLLEMLRPACLISSDGRTHALPAPLPVVAGDAVVVMSSGTTGDPKGVILTMAAVEASAEATSARLDVDRDVDRWVACLPLAHIGGLSVVTRSLVTGTAVEVHPRPDADLLASAAERGSTLVSLVPAALDRVDPGRWRRILLGGSQIPDHRPSNCIATYGMTETGSGVVYDGNPLDGVEIRIGADPSSAAHAWDPSRSVVGGSQLHEISIRSPMNARALRSLSPQGQTPEGVPSTDEHGWLATGDLGHVDSAGRLVVAGRASEVIVSAGQNIWPAPIERRILQHPEVVDVAVRERHDPDWGSIVAAEIVPLHPTTPPTVDTIKSWVRAELASYCAPRRIELVSSIERTPSGKIRRSPGLTRSRAEEG